jgi:hypothetical protein
LVVLLRHENMRSPKSATDYSTYPHKHPKHQSFLSFMDSILVK